MFCRLRRSWNSGQQKAKQKVSRSYHRASLSALPRTMGMSRKSHLTSGSSPSSAAFAAASSSRDRCSGRCRPSDSLRRLPSLRTRKGRSRSSRQALRLFPVQPAIVVSRVKNDGHARMDLGHQLVRFRRDDGIGLEPVTVLVFPGVPKPGEREETAVPKLKGIRLLRRLPFFRPLDKRSWQGSGSAFS